MFYIAAFAGHVEMFESVLLLSAEMDDGLGLLVTTRSPHGKTAAELFIRLPRFDAIWRAAASCKHERMVQWLFKHAASSCHLPREVVLCAAERGNVDTLGFLASQQLYVQTNHHLLIPGVKCV